MNVFVLHSVGKVEGAFSTWRRAEARRVELERDGIIAIITEVIING
jgi:hypothetical protein